MGKDKYKVRNWQDYNRGLKKRGEISLWLNKEVLAGWEDNEKGSNRGRPCVYSDLAIETCLTIRKVFNLALRQCEGFLVALFRSLKIDLPVPDYTVLCRRASQLRLNIKSLGTSSKAIDLIVDSTGLKVQGEGEWKVRKHGAAKHRTWMKLHLGLDAASQQIMFSKLTTNAVTDEQAVEELPTVIAGSIKSFTGDGAYDKTTVRKMLHTARIKQIIPPQKNAVINKSGKAFLRSRNKAIADIKLQSRKDWKIAVNYHRRSLAETAMFRYKTVIGANLQARSLINQKVEAIISCNILNKMLQLIKPQSYKVK
ncbi:IS5 family transposase [Chitinophaga sp. Mgbs1]|uniref:IS5 family transposase n=1 Tax=Chitinophaga solisilvae TaxID=1233460 RepID=A0A9Q5GUU4_9BACT|nr:IS5 family transposase [Chitinophaga solisilvae]NSL88704.1 IS5 family transposase [Chitinophaga solisilvae]